MIDRGWDLDLYPRQREAEERLAADIPRLLGRTVRGLYGAARVSAGTLGTITAAKVVPAIDPVGGRPWLAVDVLFAGDVREWGLALWRKDHRGDDVALGEADHVDVYLRELAATRVAAGLRMYEGLAATLSGGRLQPDTSPPERHPIIERRLAPGSREDDLRTLRKFGG